MKFGVTFIVFLLVMPTFITNTSSNDILLHFHFEQIKIKSFKDFHIVYLDSLPLHGNVGESILPVKPLYILLPPNGKLGEIKVMYKNKVSVGNGFNVPVAKEPTKLSRNDYNYNQYLARNENYSIIGVYCFRGYKILVMRIYPVKFIASTGEIFYYKDIEIKIHVKKGKISPLYRGLEKDNKRLFKLVENPDMITKYKAIKTNCKKKYDYVIITSELFVDKFGEFIEEKKDYGLNVTVVSVEDIIKNSSFWDSNPIFNDTQAKIRNFIKWAYLNWGIEYVLLAGDADVIPPRIMWAEGEFHQWYDVPSDVYYACLDGNFNNDMDNKWGEPGEEDLFAEVYVGRICIDSANELENFIYKTIQYETKYDRYISKVLLVGEDLGWGGDARWGGNHMDQLIDECNDGNYTTHGIPSDEYEIFKLYDRDWKNHRWEKEELMNLLNQGFHIVCHLGHSNYQYNMRLFVEDVLALENEKHFFAYSTGCMAGGFDYKDCIAEYFTVKTPYGAFAGIWNTRYGWGGGQDPPYNIIDYGSQRFIREFWDAVFGEGIKEIGKANQDSKEDNIWRIDDLVMRFCYYEITLFGDPSLKVKGVDKNYPTKPEKPTGVTKGKVGEEYTFSTVAYDLDGDMLYYKWDWGDGNYSKWLGPYEQGKVVNASHIWQKKGIYSVRVKVRDEYGAESEWSDALVVTMPYLRINVIEFIISLIKNYILRFLYWME